MSHILYAIVSCRPKAKSTNKTSLFNIDMYFFLRYLYDKDKRNVLQCFRNFVLIAKTPTGFTCLQHLGLRRGVTPFEKEVER